MLMSHALVSLLVFAAGCQGDEEVTPDVVSVDIKASAGGELEHPSGALLRIPAGALSKDTTVELTDRGFHALAADAVTSPLLPWSTRFALNIGDAELIGGLDVGVIPPPQADSADMGVGSNLVLTAVGADGVLRVVALDEDDDYRIGLFRPEVLPVYAADTEGWYEFELQWVPPQELVLDEGILDAPFYSQDGLQWCELASMAMLHNFHNYTTVGITSPWDLAGEFDTPWDTTGVPPDGLLKATGGIQYADGIYWDLNLIPSDPFVDYVNNVIGGREVVTTVSEIDRGVLGIAVTETGFTVDPRPIQTTSAVPGGLHGYLIVGADDDGLRVHDSSGALTGTHGMAETVSWSDYLATVAGPGDMDIWTAVFNLPVRPEAERRGSLVMLGGWDPSSFTYSDPAGADLEWTWDGAGEHEYGYYWAADSGVCASPTADLECNFPLSDGVLAGSLDYEFFIANATAFTHDFQVEMTIWQMGGGGKVVEVFHSLSGLDAHSWRENPVLGELSLEALHSEGRYQLSVVLRSGDVVQDVKNIIFEARYL